MRGVGVALVSVAIVVDEANECDDLASPFNFIVWIS
jgi:hypothetical protein